MAGQKEKRKSEVVDASWLTARGLVARKADPKHAPAFWVTARGNVIPERLTRKIELASDVLSSTEEAVYDHLLEVPCLKQTDEYRVIQVDYRIAAEATRAATTTVRRTILALIDKGFMLIEFPSQNFDRTPPKHRILTPTAVLEHQRKMGLVRWAKVGAQRAYVKLIG